MSQQYYQQLPVCIYHYCGISKTMPNGVGNQCGVMRFDPSHCWIGHRGGKSRARSDYDCVGYQSGINNYALGWVAESWEIIVGMFS